MHTQLICINFCWFTVYFSFRLKEGWTYCHYINKKESWRELGKASVSNLEIDFGKLQLQFIRLWNTPCMQIAGMGNIHYVREL